MRISAIVAIDNKNGMGKRGGIPWHIPGEQKRFKDITTPHPMIMGRKTFESIGRVLPGRPHIIVTRDTTYHSEGVTVAHTIQEAIENGKELEESRIMIQDSGEESASLPTASHNDEGEVFIIGGGQIFKEAMPFLDRLYLTIIEKEFECDTFFPDYSDFTKVIEKEEKEFEGTKFTYVTLEKAV